MRQKRALRNVVAVSKLTPRIVTYLLVDVNHVVHKGALLQHKKPPNDNQPYKRNPFAVDNKED